MFEDSNNKSNNVGVVVSPARILSLGEFGTPEFVADKLIQAERRKVSRLFFPNLDCLLCFVVVWFVVYGKSVATFLNL